MSRFIYQEHCKELSQGIANHTLAERIARDDSIHGYLAAKIYCDAIAENGSIQDHTAFTTLKKRMLEGKKKLRMFTIETAITAAISEYFGKKVYMSDKVPQYGIPESHMIIEAVVPDAAILPHKEERYFAFVASDGTLQDLLESICGKEVRTKLPLP